MLEEECPQLYGVDKDVWISLIHRDVPNANIIPPKNPRLWWKVYRKMHREHEIEVEKDTEQLKAAFSGIKSAKDKRQILIKDGVPHIPKLDGMQYAHCADYNKAEYKRKKKISTKRPTITTTSVLKFDAGSKTKVLTGKGVLDKARREARDMDRFKAQSPLSVPTHKLSSGATQVREAPKYLVEEFRKPPPPKPYDPTVPKPTLFVPPKRRVEKKDAHRSSGIATIEERERRLRALTNPSTANKTTTTTPSSMASMTPRSSTKKPSFSTPATTSSSTATPLHLPESQYVVDKAALATSSTPSSNLKRKAEDLPTVSSIEVDSSGIPNNQRKAYPSPPRLKIPHLTRSPESPGIRPPKKKAPADPFMPAKKRRIA
ncbi:MAG: hypothetical protein Q9216_002092 [Gyalolechia sp. 2 TL-2023]